VDLAYSLFILVQGNGSCVQRFSWNMKYLIPDTRYLSTVIIINIFYFFFWTYHVHCITILQLLLRPGAWFSMQLIAIGIKYQEVFDALMFYLISRSNHSCVCGLVCVCVCVCVITYSIFVSISLATYVLTCCATGSKDLIATCEDICKDKWGKEKEKLLKSVSLS